MANPNLPGIPTQGQGPVPGNSPDSQPTKTILDQTVEEKAQGVLSTPTSSWFGSLTGAVSYVTGKASDLAKGATKKAVGFLVGYSGDKAALIADSKQIMLNETKDSQFPAFFETVKSMVVSVISGKLNQKIAGSKDRLLGEIITTQRQLILDIVEINLAKGFANLAKQADEKQEDIPGYDQQPSLINILSLICQECSSDIDAKELRKLEEKYREAQTKMGELKKKLGITEGNIFDPESLDLLPLSHELGLFSANRERAKDVEEFIEVSRLLKERDEKLKAIFSKLADKILMLLFPNKFQDMELPPILKPIAETLFNWLAKGTIVELLQSSYEPMEDNVVRREEWIADLQTRLVAPDLKAVIEAPTAFGLAFAKDFIQSNPKAVSFTAKALDQFQPKNLSPKIAGMEAEEKFLAKLSQEELADWLVKSIQGIVNSNDPNLIGLGRFVDRSLNNLILAMLDKGAKLAIPDGQPIQGDLLVKVLTDRLVAKFSSFKGTEEIPEEFWKEFLDDLPLPPLVKELVLPILVEQTKPRQGQVKELVDLYTQVNQLYLATEAEVRSYHKGEELISIAEKVSELIIQPLIEKPFEFISTFGLGDTYDELLTQYLPGVKIDENLKKWFKDNISALQESETGAQAQLIDILKRGMEAVILKALDNTIKATITKKEDYAAQLLGKIHHAFIIAVGDFDDAKREELSQAFTIQTKIQLKQSEIDKLRAELAEIPPGLNSKQKELLEEAFKANMRLIRAEEYIHGLEANFKEKTAGLNLSKEDLSYLNRALDIHQRKNPLFQTKADYLVNLKKESENLQLAVNSPDPISADSAKENLKALNLLGKLLEMPTDKYQLVEEAVFLLATIENGENEREKLVEAMTKRLKAVNDHEFEKLTNRPEWEKAVPWMKGILPKRGQLHQLTKEIAALHHELDSKLSTFQVLSAELTKLLGLDQMGNLQLPPIIEAKVWPLIEKAKKTVIARHLFEQLTPPILTSIDVNQNKEKLKKLSNGDTFLVQLASNVSKEAIDRISDYVTNYRPFAELILDCVEKSNPSQKEILDMEDELRFTMINAGRKGMTASLLQPLLKGLVPSDTEEAISLSIEKWVIEDHANEISKDKMKEFLQKEMPSKNSKEEKALEKVAQTLSHLINEFLINHGKGNLTPIELLGAYQRAQKVSLSDAEIESAKAKLNDGKVVEKIKAVVITYDELAETLNDIIPGAKDLQNLIKDQFEQMVVGKDKDLQANRKFVQDYIEGFLLQFFVKIGEANVNTGETVMEVLARKLKEKVPTAQDLKNKTSLEVARQIVDDVLQDVLGISSMHDLDGIPIALRKVIYSKLKEQAYLQLTPLLLPMIERDKNRIELQKASGSTFFGDVSTALAKDIFTLIPIALSSYRAIASEMFILLSPHHQPTEAEIDGLAEEIDKLVKLEKQQVITQDDLALSFAKVAKTPVIPEFKEKLENHKVLEGILNVLITPEEITEAVGNVLPTVDKKLLKALAGEMHDLTHSSKAYESFSSFGEAAIEGVLLKLFMHVAQKNPPQNGEESVIILTKKLMIEVVKKYKEQKANISPTNEILKELNDWIVVELLGIESSASFNGLPDSVKETLYLKLKDFIGGLLVKSKESLATLVDQNPNRSIAKENAQILAEDLSNLLVTTVPKVLTEMGTHKMIGVNFISKGVASYLEELSGKNLAIGSVILNFTQAGTIQDILGDVLKEVGAEGKYPEEVKKAKEMAANLILKPLKGIKDQAVKFEEKKGVAFDQKLIANVLVAAADHLKNLNEARVLAAANHRSSITHKDFVNAAKGKLHPAVPKTAVSFDETIEAIGTTLYSSDPSKWPVKWSVEQKNLRDHLIKLSKQDANGKVVMSIEHVIAIVQRINSNVTGGHVILLDPAQLTALKNYRNADGLDLRDLIRKEWEAPDVQRQKEFYGPAIQTVMKMIFPNGKGDLTFVPEELRNPVWKICEKNLFPSVLPMLTELILNPQTINQMVLNSLKLMNENLKGPIVLEPGEPADRPLDAIDQAAGALIKEALKLATLPDLIRNQLRDSQTGEITPAVQKAFAATLRKQFNGQFIKETIEKAFEKVVERDKGGNYLLKPEPLDVKAAAEKDKVVQKELKNEVREMIDVSISYYIRSTWVQAQDRFDKFIEGALGKIGAKLKRALDEVFGFIFFKIIGTILYYLIYPVKGFLKEKIYELISLDVNLSKIMSLLTKAPSDQPLTEGHVVYNEALFYNIFEAIEDTVTSFLTAPVIPIPAADAVLPSSTMAA